jgi:aryl-alcohol dehydrogenase-like predicted oxidoreductase
MKYRNLGSTGLRVSIVGIGCNNFGMRCDEAQSIEVVHAALDLGINFFDTADVYGERHSEEMLGKAIAGKDRSQIVIATKFGMPMGDGILQKGASRQYIFSAVEASLRRLNTDYIDLYQQHAPDPKTPMDETLSALDDLVTAGKVRYLGNSNYSGWQIADADWISRHNGYQRFVTAQNHYNLLERGIEAEVLPACEKFGIGMLPYFPLASGLLTGKYTRGQDAPEGTRLANFGERGKRALSDRNFDVIEKLTAYAQSHDKTLLQLAMSWLASKPVVSSVIAGATGVSQVQANADAVSWTLDDAAMEDIAALLKT